MEKPDYYLNYSADNFAEDSFFWKWVLAEDKEADSFWQDFIKRSPNKKVAIEKAKVKVLEVNAQKYRLSNKKVTSLWAKIKQSKNKETGLDSANLTSYLSGPFPFEKPQGNNSSNLLLS